MDTEEKEALGFIIFTVLFSLGVGYGVGFGFGYENTVASTRQTICREFMKETPDYINCNTKGLDELIKMIKEK